MRIFILKNKPQSKGYIHYKCSDLLSSRKEKKGSEIINIRLNCIFKHYKREAAITSLSNHLKDNLKCS